MYRIRFKRWGLGKRSSKRSSKTVLTSRPKHQKPSSSSSSSSSPPSQQKQQKSLLPEPPEEKTYSLQHLRPPDHHHSAETLYRAISTYYTFSFSTSRWHFEEDASPSQLFSSQKVIQTSLNLHRAFLIWRRFNTAINLFSNPCSSSKDKTSAIKIIRISFHDLSSTLLSSHESPTLLFFLMHIFLLLRTSSPSGTKNPTFESIESSLLRHLHDLTSTSFSQPSPTSILFRTLSHSFSTTTQKDLTSHTANCLSAAKPFFTTYLPPLHKRTLELQTLSISLSTSSQEQLPSYLSLFQKIQSLEKFDSRDLDIRAWLSSHFLSSGQTEKASHLLKAVLHHKEKSEIVNSIPAAFACLNLLMGNILLAQGKLIEAEEYIRQVVKKGKEAWVKDKQDAYYSDGLLALEHCLKVQGRMEEAEKVFRVHEALLKDALVLRGEEG
ncbi:hypothetical protein QBC38DRAFT_361587 [Podospora fimiseda]|uniref:Uncharacterized protein n=1 Tax=Podospora fimiseda TaxID=252190 RepID=A0AAN7H1E4_9PEZI|nr:hypothetical protein QBC38DRAFT_361587 [Podospora fimiseda]